MGNAGRYVILLKITEEVRKILSNLVKAMLIITSFSPVLFTYGFLLYLEEGKSFIKIFILLGIVLILVLLCWYIIERAKRCLEIVNFPIQSVKTADGEILGFLVVYLLPFVSITSDTINEPVLLFILLIFSLVAWSTNSYHVNPLLTIFGYHFYEVVTEQNVTFLLMTKNTLRNTKSINSVVQLTDYMVLDINER